jgi:coenzyme F420-reducing hydrogenase delta subunit/Pyruvate/2-oxoacid:ferredoxin oxidoreductase delta subunit
MSNGSMQSTTLASQAKVNKRILVLGHGLTAKSVVRELAQLGFQSLNLSLDESRAGRQEERGNHDDLMIPHSIERPPSGRIIDFQGFPGAFRVGIAWGEEERRVEEVGAVAIAADCFLESTLGQWGFAPSETVWPLSDFARRLNSEPDWLRSGPGEPRTVVFLCGFTHHSYPHTQRKAFECGLNLSSTPNVRTIFLLEQFKVAQEGMERMTRQARENGILFVKLSRPGPRIRAEGERLTVTYFDETLGEDLTVSPDLLVVEEACRPPVSAPSLANVLRVTLDPGGFFQGDHIHNQPIFTNRTGIWVVGTGKGPQSQGESEEEAKALALEVLDFFGEDSHEVALSRIGKNVARCSRCLTCYRVCPHRAISHSGDDIPSFSDLACRGCGICAAECPMQAIDLQGATGTELKSEIRAREPHERAGTIESAGPRILAFVCQNSAYESWRHARLLGVKFPGDLKLIKVPCVGRVDEDFLLTALTEEFEAVLVLGCHHDSCKSVEGSVRCERRVKELKAFLSRMGLKGDRIMFGTTGPGKPYDFVRAYECARVAAAGRSTPEAGLSDRDEGKIPRIHSTPRPTVKG